MEVEGKEKLRVKETKGFDEQFFSAQHAVPVCIWYEVMWVFLLWHWKHTFTLPHPWQEEWRIWWQCLFFFFRTGKMLWLSKHLCCFQKLFCFSFLPVPNLWIVKKWRHFGHFYLLFFSYVSLLSLVSYVSAPLQFHFLLLSRLPLLSLC